MNHINIDMWMIPWDEGNDQVNVTWDQLHRSTRLHTWEPCWPPLSEKIKVTRNKDVGIKMSTLMCLRGTRVIIMLTVISWLLSFQQSLEAITWSVSLFLSSKNKMNTSMDYYCWTTTSATTFVQIHHHDHEHQRNRLVFICKTRVKIFKWLHVKKKCKGSLTSSDASFLLHFMMLLLM